MGATGIEWTIGPNGEPGFTFNPWIGCTKILGSDPSLSACLNCYAETAAIKLETEWGPHAIRRGISDGTWRGPLAWDRRAAREGRRFRVFVASMADVLDNHKSIDPEWRARLYNLIALTPNLDWLMLTKRPENARKFLPYTWFMRLGWPSNVWFGFTAETQATFDQRARVVRTIPAPVRFVSMEPLLGSIELPDDAVDWLDWVICGGESGPLSKIRDTPLEDFEHMAFQCLMLRSGDRIGIPFFMKQMPQLSFRGAYKKFDLFPTTVRVREHPMVRLVA